MHDEHACMLVFDKTILVLNVILESVSCTLLTDFPEWALTHFLIDMSSASLINKNEL